MLIEVTQEDIDKGEQFDHCKCPVALAIKRTLGTDYVDVSFSYVRLSEFVCREGFIVSPQSVQKFIKDFDNGKDVTPFSFELEAV